MNDLKSNLLVSPSLVPAARTATATGTSVDRYASGASFQKALVLVSAGNITDGTHTITVEESDDNAAWSTVAAGDLNGALPAIGAADDNKTWGIEYLGMKRFLRTVATVAGATTGGVYSVAVVLGAPRVAATVWP